MKYPANWLVCCYAGACLARGLLLPLQQPVFGLFYESLPAHPITCNPWTRKVQAGRCLDVGGYPRSGTGSAGRSRKYGHCLWPISRQAKLPNISIMALHTGSGPTSIPPSVTSADSGSGDVRDGCAGQLKIDRPVRSGPFRSRRELSSVGSRHS